MPNSNLDLEYQFQDMLAQQKRFKNEKEQDNAQVKQRKAGVGQLIRTEPISKGASLQQKARHRYKR